MSEREKRMLEEMETQLLAEDPALATSMSRRRPPVGVIGILVLAAGVAGLVMMVIGVLGGQLPGMLLAWVGFVVLLGAVSAIGEWSRARGEQQRAVVRAPGRARRAA